MGVRVCASCAPQDEPVCRLLEGACSDAPLFSHIKRYDWEQGRWARRGCEGWFARARRIGPNAGGDRRQARRGRREFLWHE